MRKWMYIILFIIIAEYGIAIPNYGDYQYGDKCYGDKCISEIQLYINGSASNYSSDATQLLNVTGLLLIGDGNITIYKNSSIYNHGTSPLSNTTNFNYTNLFNITLIYDGNENFTTSQTSLNILLRELFIIFGFDIYEKTKNTMILNWKDIPGIATSTSCTFNQTLCQISTNNITFIDINTTLYDGCIDEVTGIAYINNLGIETDYYVRCKNSSTKFGYRDTQTLSTDQNNYFYFYIAIFFVFLVLLGLGYYYEKEVFVILAGFTILVTALNLYSTSFPNLTNTFLQNTIVIILFGIGAYLVIKPSISYMEENF